MARAKSGGETVWLLHVAEAPFTVGDQEEPPWLLLVLDRGRELVVCAEVLAAPAPRAIAERVTRALDEVPAGARPRELRTEDRILAEFLAEALEVPVRCAPTPEVEPALEHLIRSLDASMQRGGPGAPRRSTGDAFVPGGKRPTEKSRALFAAAADLYRAAPWKTLADSELLCVESDDAALDGTVVSIIGSLGQNRGLLAFRSVQDFDRFLVLARAREVGERSRRRDRATRALVYLGLDFNPREGLSPALGRALAKAELPLAAPDALPLSYRVTGAERMDPTSTEETARLTVLAEAVAGFWREHGTALRRQDAAGAPLAPRSHTLHARSGEQLTIRGPISALEEDIDEDAPPRRHFDLMPALPLVRPSSPSARPRNAPCPCGSGKKYKLCHEAEDARTATRSIEELRYLRTRLDLRIARHARARFGDALFDEPGVLFADSPDPDEVIAPLLLALGLYHFPREEAGDATAAALFERSGEPLEPVEVDADAAHRAAWLSLWQVTAVRPGESVALRDLLTGETRTALERQASQGLHLHEVLLAFVVDFPESTQLYGMYGRALPVSIGEEVADELLAQLTATKRASRKGAKRRPKEKASASTRHLAVEQLRELESIVLVARAFVMAMNALLLRPPPTLHTTSGDPLLSTTDHFSVTRDAGADPDDAALREALAGAGFVADDEEASRTTNVALRMTLTERTDHAALGGERVLGSLRLEGDRLEVHTLSVARADRLRALVQGALGTRVRHRLRSHEDPMSQLASGRTANVSAGARPLDPAQLPPELLAELGRRGRAHWDGWCDIALPALDGKTPRQAAASAALRPRLERLLRDFESWATADGDPFAPDVPALRRTLRL